jgi:hypothetical protein
MIKKRIRAGEYENPLKMYQYRFLIKNEISLETIDNLKKIILSGRELTEEEKKLMYHIITMLLQTVSLSLIKKGEKGYCYIGKDNSGLYKIGMTRNLKERVRVIKNINPSFSIILNTYDDYYRYLEKLLHVNFFFYHVLGEWFCLPHSMLQGIKDEFGFKNTAYRIPLDNKL